MQVRSCGNNSSKECWRAHAQDTSSRSTSRYTSRRTHRKAYACCLPHIKVVGVGGAASQAVGWLWDQETARNVDLMIINTDVQEMSNTFMPDSDKLLIGAHTTSWMGTQGDHERGQVAALESSQDITDALRGADVVFILAGMAGGTGRGAAPVVAHLGQQVGAVTISLAVLPAQYRDVPEDAAMVCNDLSQASDCHLTLYNQHLKLKNHVLDAAHIPITCCVQGVTRLLAGEAPLAVQELREMVKGGRCALGFAVAHGPDRVARAVYAAIGTPQCAKAQQQATAVMCFVAEADSCTDVLSNEVRDVLSSHFRSVTALHVQAVSTDLPPGLTAVTLLVKSAVNQAQHGSNGPLGNSSGSSSSGRGSNSTLHSDAVDADAEDPELN